MEQLEINNQKVICFDFDGVIAEFAGWKGVDIFGKPNLELIEIINKLKDEGYYILIFTTRQITQKLISFLNENNVKYDAINCNKHNPEGTSFKPIYHVFVDDRAIGYRKQSSNVLYEEIKELLKSDL